MSYLCLFPCFGDAAKRGQMYIRSFFPLKTKPLVCETECAGRIRSEAEADGDNRGTETLSKLNPLTKVFKEVIPVHRFLNTQLIAE